MAWSPASRPPYRIAAIRRRAQPGGSVFVGDIAQDIRERLKSNPKTLERELGSQ
jgi:hypothetical protein